MQYSFFDEFLRDDDTGGFWIFNKFQTYGTVLIGAMSLPIYTLFLPLFLRVLLAVITGGLLGFLLGAKYRGIPGFMYIVSFVKYQFATLMKNNILYASGFGSQSVAEETDDDFKLVGAKTSLPKSLDF